MNFNLISLSLSINEKIINENKFVKGKNNNDNNKMSCLISNKINF